MNCKTDVCTAYGCIEKPVLVNYFESACGTWKDSRPYCKEHDYRGTIQEKNAYLQYRNTEWLVDVDIEKATKEALSAAFKMDDSMKLQGNVYASKFDLNSHTDANAIDHDTKALYSRQPHYEGGIDPITFGQDNLSGTEMGGFYKMNVIKYVARCDRKNGLEDLQKARDYLNLLIDVYVKRSEPVPCEPEEEFFMEKCERLGRERAEREENTSGKVYNFKKFVHDLESKGDTFIPKEAGEQLADAVADYAEEHYKNVSQYQNFEGYGVVVCNKKRPSHLIIKHWETEGEQ